MKIDFCFQECGVDLDFCVLSLVQQKPECVCVCVSNMKRL